MIFVAHVLNSVQSANIPTVTVTRQATVRFPIENASKPLVPRIVVSSTTTERSTTWTTIQPSKTVSVIGNYSVAVQQFRFPKTTTQSTTTTSTTSTTTTTTTASTTTTLAPKALEEKNDDILALLDRLRQLPLEKVVEILYGTNASVSTTTTESALEHLNQLREKQRPVEQSSTTESPVDQTEIYEEETTILLIEDDESISSDVLISQISDDEELAPKTQVNAPPSLPAVEEEAKAVYEFTDYPPPLPPPSIRLEFPTAAQGNNGDTSFAVGVAVGILACVIVAATGVTWCVCRKHWGRRNVYATMEAEEIPRAFTKPGPPVILPQEFDQASAVAKREQESSNPQSNCVTEL